jgi:hypothetical protein
MRRRLFFIGFVLSTYFYAWFCVLFMTSTTFPHETLSVEPWVGVNTLRFAKRWGDHKVRNPLLYACIGTRNFPFIGNALRSMLSCPEAIYDSRYDVLFRVPKICLAHSCLEKYGKSHFVYAAFVLGTYDHVVSCTLRPALATARGKIAVLVEPRLHPLLEYTSKQVMSTLSPEWSLQLFVSDENEKYVRERFHVHIGGAGEHIIISNLKSFGLSDMSLSGNRLQSAFSAHEKLYKSIKGEHILWFQLDVVLRNTPQLEWLEYAYVGSEWRGCEYPCNTSRCDLICNGGNSGLSLRRRSKMQLVATRGSLPEELWGVNPTERDRMELSSGFFEDDELRNNSDTRWFEDDLQISCKLQTLDLLPPGHILPRFAISEALPTEGLENVKPSGIHKSWMSPNIHPMQLIYLLELPYTQITT